MNASSRSKFLPSWLSPLKSSDKRNRIAKVATYIFLVGIFIFNPITSKAETNQGEFYAATSGIRWHTRGEYGIGTGTDDPGKSNLEDVRNANLDTAQILRFGYRTESFSVWHFRNLRFFAELNYIKTEYNRSQENLHKIYPIIGIQKDFDFKYFLVKPKIGAGVVEFDKYREILIGDLELAFSLDDGDQIFIGGRYDYFGGPTGIELVFGISSKKDFDDNNARDPVFELEEILSVIIPGALGEGQEIDTGGCRSEVNLLFGKDKTRFGIQFGLESLESKLDTVWGKSDKNKRSVDLLSAGIFIDREIAKYKKLGNLICHIRFGVSFENFEKDITFLPSETGTKSWEPGLDLKTGFKLPISNSAYLNLAVSERFFPGVDCLDLLSIGGGLGFRF